MALTNQGVLHKRTSIADNKPSSEQLNLGEIAINMNSATTRLYVKRIDNTIAEFYDNKYISGTYATIKDMEDNEKVVATALINLNNTKESLSNKVTSLSSGSTDTQYPSAKAVYDVIKNVATSAHTHDDRYYQKSEVDTLLAGKSDTGHTHSEYATVQDLEEDEFVITTAINVLDENKENKSNKTTIVDNTSTDTQYPSAKAVYGVITGHNHDDRYSLSSHTHSGVYATVQDLEDAEEVAAAALNELNTRLDGKSDTGHNHDDRYSLSSHTHSGVYATVQDLEDAEEVAAAALNELNTRLDGKSDTGHTHTIETSGDTWINVTGGTNSVTVAHSGPGTATTTGGTEVISASTSIKGIKLDSKGHVVDVITGGTMAEGEEKVISAAINDLNTNKQDKLIISGGNGGNSATYYVAGHTLDIEGGSANTLYVFTGVSIYGNSVHASQGFYQNSDENLKTFDKNISVDFSKIKSIPKKYFYWNTDDNKEHREIGTSAQKVMEVYPEIVTKSDDGTLNMSYDKLSIIALAAIDKLNERLTALEKENKELRKLLQEK